ncbi:MAG: VPLPA-CTERM sorting domain-containing protein [Gammaproteobacteria bacterium]|nr:VPLPA-CTERM sorting domain-containing protein [Gammaproteobacteria bacterium]
MKFWKLASAATALTMSTSVNAAIISVDWQSAGDNLITQDTDSGLEWLDLTVTNGVSLSEIYAQLDVGGTYEGWRYATRAEVAGLWDSFGGDSNYYNGLSTQNNGLFDAMAPFVGDTYVDGNYSSRTPGDYYSIWVTGDISPSGGHYSATAADTWYEPLYETHDFFKLSDLEANNITPDMGHALVREVTTVPVPAAVWLFGSGLIGLVGLARRKKA